MIEIVLAGGEFDEDKEWSLQERVIARIIDGVAKVSFECRQNSFDTWEPKKFSGLDLSFKQIRILGDLMEALEKSA